MRFPTAQSLRRGRRTLGSGCGPGPARRPEEASANKFMHMISEQDEERKTLGPLFAQSFDLPSTCRSPRTPHRAPCDAFFRSDPIPRPIGTTGAGRHRHRHTPTAPCSAGLVALSVPHAVAAVLGSVLGGTVSTSRRTGPRPQPPPTPRLLPPIPTPPPSCSTTVVCHCDPRASILHHTSTTHHPPPTTHPQVLVGLGHRCNDMGRPYGYLRCGATATATATVTHWQERGERMARDGG